MITQSDSKALGVPDAAVEAAEARLIGENPPGTKAWHDQTRVEIRATLEAAYPEIHRAVVAELLSTEGVATMVRVLSEKGWGILQDADAVVPDAATLAARTMTDLRDAVTAALNNQADNQGEAEHG